MKNYIVARVMGSYSVLAAMQNGTYEVYGEFGDMVARAKTVANLLNELSETPRNGD